MNDEAYNHLVELAIADNAQIILIMSKNYRIYLDVCCLNRPFDQQSQARIRLETEAILEIINYCQRETWTLITSNVLEAEISQTPNQERIENVKKILSIAKIKVLSGDWLKERASQLQKLGFASYDAAHVASAERASSDIFLTTDDRLVRKSAPPRLRFPQA